MPGSKSRKRRREQRQTMMSLPCFCHSSTPSMPVYTPPSAPQIPTYWQPSSPMPPYSQQMGPPMPNYSQQMGPPMPPYSQKMMPPMPNYSQQMVPPMPPYSQEPVRSDDALRSFISSIGRSESAAIGSSGNEGEPGTSSNGRSTEITGASRKRRIDTTLPPDVASFTHECPVCLDELIEPKQLHCGHNLCPNCVNNNDVNTALSTSTTTTDSEGKSVTVKIICPLCKQVTESTKLLATNYALKETVEKAKRMKLHYESKMDEMNNSLEPCITCADCGESCEEKCAIACIGAPCVNRRRVTITNGEALIYSRPYTFTIVSCKQLCAYCACRSHRRHNLHPLSAMASRSRINKAIRNTTTAEGEFRKLRSCLQIDDEIGDIAEMVLARCTVSLKEYNNELRYPDEPLRKGLVDAIEHRNSQFVERVKAAITDKAKMIRFGNTLRQHPFKTIKEKIADLLR